MFLRPILPGGKPCFFPWGWRSLCLRVICRCDTVRAEELGLAPVTRKYIWPVSLALPEETGLAYWKQGSSGGKDLHITSHHSVTAGCDSGG